jgi:inorganic pyrophosphatase
MKYSLEKAHPWHGIEIGPKTPQIITAFVEIVPSDTIKYEIDKDSGYLKIDRPQKYSNIVPSLYGFIPKTYCGQHIADLARKNSNKEVIKGDGDPLDICILSSHNIAHGDILLQAKPIGGFCLLDKGEADDKIIAVLMGDPVYDAYAEISQLPPGVLAKLRHYFLTYKNLPHEPNTCEIGLEYGSTQAHQVILEAIKDYENLIQS